jgi:predicted transcriptional regulator of viral defense system
MRYEQLLELVGDQGFFDLASVVQLSGERRETIRVQLHRWMKAGKLLALRRGMYAFAERYRRGGLHPAKLANALMSPSYISTHWALGFFGLIPERVVTYTSVTSRTPGTFENDFGTFTYRHVKREAFFGYRSLHLDGESVLLAEPEKALLDLWYLEKGVWTAARMKEMRFQNPGTASHEKLLEYAARFGSPSLLRAAGVWSEVCAREEEGTEEL